MLGSPTQAPTFARLGQEGMADDELTAQRIIPYLKVPDEGVVRLVPRAPGLVENNRRTGSLFSKFLVAALMCEHARYARKLSQNVGIFPRYVLPNMPKQQDWRKVKIRGRKSPMDQKQCSEGRSWIDVQADCQLTPTWRLCRVINCKPAAHDHMIPGTAGA
ncbi:hypothetical protein FA13DRAFT_1717569 [Coprinellus micaceus]|uniref:Uncharacterized protein n=1 Tax=Coprinellus micaceus TaxID=71717 RepID=A0A4Y7SFN9_COPMI|nr:hypothetical protein FA13DRAFT_1717569 [Coprinellus micaceus]